MTTNLAPAAPVQERREPDDSTLRLVIAYDDLAAYRHALRALAYLVPKARTGGTHISPRLWRFDALAEADSSFRAVADGAMADIVMVSMSGEGPLPAAVEAWLPACLGRKDNPQSAVVVLVGGPDGPKGPGSQPYLFVRHMARMAGWEFISLMTAPGVSAWRAAELCATG
jgi:hypothetical protein